VTDEVKSPLFDTEAERLFLSGAVCGQVDLEQLCSADFFSMANRLIFDSMVALRSEGSPVNRNTVTTHMSTRNLLGAINGELDGLSGGITTDEADAHALRIQENAALRKVREYVEAILIKIDIKTPPSEISTELALASELASIDGSRIASYKDLHAKIEAWQIKSPYLSLGFEQLKSFEPKFGNLVVIGARTNTGKTAFALDLLERVHDKGIGGESHKVAFISMETSKETINGRRVARHAGLDIGALQGRRRFRDHEFKPYHEGMNHIKKTEESGAIICGGSFTTQNLIVEVRRMAGKGCKAVFVDHLGKVILSARHRDRTDIAIGEVTAGLARVAVECDVVVFLLCQLNRQPTHRPGQKPSLADLKNSGNIEEDADAVWMLHVDDDDADPRATPIDVLVVKHRDGGKGTAELITNRQVGRFKDKEILV